MARLDDSALILKSMTIVLATPIRCSSEIAARVQKRFELTGCVMVDSSADSRLAVHFGAAAWVMLTGWDVETTAMARAFLTLLGTASGPHPASIRGLFGLDAILGPYVDDAPLQKLLSDPPPAAAGPAATPPSAPVKAAPAAAPKASPI